MKHLLRHLLWCLILLPTVFATAGPPHELKGRVLHAGSGEVLTGATVLLLNTKQSTTTDVRGYFVLPGAEATGKVRISYVGFRSRELTISEGQVADIRLELVEQQLEEVTVRTGYQQLPKERSNGSFEVIDSNLLNRIPSYDILGKLDGQAGSIFFSKTNGSQRYSIRGISSLTSTLQQPLIIIDNFPYEGDIEQINPNDIEQVTVLKDAAASSIWGSRAGNGVIVISTKKGRKNSKPAWKFNFNSMLAPKPDLFYLSRMSSADFIEVEKFLFDKGFYNSALNNTTSRPVISPVVEWLQLQKNGQLTAAEVEQRINAVSQNDVRNDFLEYLYRPALLQQYHLQLSGGDKLLDYLMAAGYDRQRENTVGDQYQRFTFRTDNNYHPTEKLQIDAGIIYTHLSTEQNNPGDYFNLSPGGGKAVYYPYAQLADENGPLALMKDYRAGYTDTAGAGRLFDWKYRPLEELNYLDNQQTTDHLLGKFGIRYTIIKGLEAELRYQVEKGFSNNRYHYSTATYLVRDMVNRYSQITGSTVKYNLPYGEILDENSSELFSQQGRAMLSYQLQRENHQLAAIVGAELRQAKNESQGSRTYGYSEDPLSFANVDYVSNFPIYGNLSGALPIQNRTSFAKALRRYVSLFGNATYTWQQRYSISGSVRKDGSNMFGVNSNQRTVPLWSAGAGWVVSNEKFYQWPVLDHLKLRATYGASGNTNNSVTAYSTIRYYPATGNLVNLPYAGVTSPANPDLQWEKVRMLNIAIDFAGLQKRLSGSVEYYRKWADHLLTDAPLDPTTGFTTATFNNGKMNGRGVECTLNYTWIQKKFQWTSNLLFNYATSRISKYDIVAGSNAYVGSENSINALEGKAPYGLYAYDWAGLSSSNGDPIGRLDGKESVSYSDIVRRTPLDQLKYYGSSRPPYFGALRNSFSYGPWRLSANITYQLGHYFRVQSIQYNLLYSSWVTNNDYVMRWQQPGDELRTHVPSMPYPSNNNRDAFYAGAAVLVQKADHIRLQDVRLHYQFNWGKQRAHPVQLFFYANNLLLLWKANNAGMDPAYGNGIPAARNYSIGFQASL